jgi:diguanylate cyclase (GGDEF)-like protein
MKYNQTIGFRLIATVVATGAIALFILAMVVSNRMHNGLTVQSEALGRLSKELLIKQLYGDAHLARDRLEELSTKTIKDTQATASKQNTVKAVFTGNDVGVSESLKASLKTSDIDVYIAVNDKGRVIGTTAQAGFFTLSDALDESQFAPRLIAILTNNERDKPVSHFSFYQTNSSLLKALNYTGGNTHAFTAIQPVFDEFGETVGAIIGMRFLKSEEQTLNKFSELSNTDVLVIMGTEVFSRTDRGKITNLRVKLFHTADENLSEFDLFTSSDVSYLASCARYIDDFKICVAANAGQVTRLQERMSDIGRQQTSQIQLMLYLVATLMMVSITFIMFFVVKHTMRGLPQLAIAANDVAKGHLNVPFKPMGYGEISELSIAFDRMLRNLRISTARVQQLAYNCPITGLANREKLQEEAKLLFENQEIGSKVMMMVDIRRFKTINENYGMRAGDFVLKKTGERLVHIFEFFAKHHRLSNVTVARSGGDIFVVMFKTNADREGLGKLCMIIAASLAKPLRIGSSNVIIESHVGIGFYPQDGVNFEELTAHTQLALESIDKKGSNRYAFFDKAMAKASNDRLEIEADLKEALKSKALMVYYQPKISLSNGKVMGGEALVRWIHPTKGFISPAKFIPVAEEAGLIGDIGRFVLEKSIDETKILIDEGYKVTVAVNVSALQLEDPSFADEVLALIEAKNFPFEALELEITESMAMSDPQGVKERISKLRAKGIRFSMDDFGTGYSNLSQLANMPIDILKLDRSLIMNVDQDERKQSLARSILELAADFGFKTVVEGVENSGELAFCLNHDADMVQGFIFSGAQPLDKYRPLLSVDNFKEKFDVIGGTRNEREKLMLRHVKAPKLAEVMA